MHQDALRDSVMHHDDASHNGSGTARADESIDECVFAILSVSDTFNRKLKTIFSQCRERVDGLSKSSDVAEMAAHCCMNRIVKIWGQL